MDALTKHIGQTLSLREDLLLEIDNRDQLLALVTQYIQELIDHDFEFLLRTLYRIDVGEENVKKAIDFSGPNNAAETIAKLILDREAEKVKSRANDGTAENEWIF